MKVTPHSLWTIAFLHSLTCQQMPATRRRRAQNIESPHGNTQLSHPLLGPRSPNWQKACEHNAATITRASSADSNPSGQISSLSRSQESSPGDLATHLQQQAHCSHHSPKAGISHTGSILFARTAPGAGMRASPLMILPAASSQCHVHARNAACAIAISTCTGHVWRQLRWRSAHHFTHGIGSA